MRFTFVCDANDRVGLGHFSRCYNIALGLRALDRTVEASFCGDLNPFASRQIASAGFTMAARLGENEAASSLVIHDSYEVDQSAVDVLIAASRRFVKVDDFNELDLSKADGVINFRIGAEDERYACPNAFLGLRYFPAHPSLLAIRQASIGRSRDWRAQPVETVLLFIGGVDRFGAGAMVLSRLDRVVRGKRFVLLEKPGAASGTIPVVNNNLTVEPFARRIADYFAATDVVISGGGLMKYDAGFSCLPNACISQTAQQQQDTVIAASHGLTYDLGPAGDHASESARFESALMEFLSPPALARQHARMAACYDGQSSHRLAEALLDLNA